MKSSPRIHSVAAGVVSFSLVCHFWPMLDLPLNRLRWCVVVAAGTVALVWPMGQLVRFVRRVWTGHDWRRAIVTCVGFGVLLNAAACYRFGQWGSNLWVHERHVAAALGPVLWLCDGAILASVLGVLLTVFYPPHLGTQAPPRTRSLSWTVVVGALVWINLGVWQFVSHERTAHYWDYAGYWLSSSMFAETLTRSPTAAWQDVVYSFVASDYTLFPAVLPGLVMAVAGDSRLAYELAVGNLFGGGVVLAAVVAVGRIGKAFAPAGVAAVVVTLPSLWDPTFRGYLDLGGVALALAALAVYLERPPSDLRWPHILALGTALAAVILFRRWYNFWVVAFLAVALAEAAVTTVRRVGFRLADWRAVVVAGGVAVVLFASVAGPTLRRVAGTDYADIYAGYRMDSDLLSRIDQLGRDIGYGYVAGYVVAFVAVVARTESRRAGLFATAMVPVILAQFLRVQDMGPHHQLLLVPSFLLVVGLAVAALRRVTVIGCVSVIALLAAGFVVSFLPGLNAVRTAAEPWTPRGAAYPEVRADIDELLALADDARRESEARGTRFVVLSSSTTLNQFHALTVRRSLGFPGDGPGRQLIVAEVDKTSGFPDTFFECGVVVAVSTPQTHLPPDEQVGVTTLSQLVWDGRGLGRSFDRLPRVYQLSNGVRAQVFVRRRAFRPAEVDEFCQHLRAAHPTRPFVYQPRQPIETKSD